MSTMTLRKSSYFRYIAFTVLTAFAGLLPVGPGWAQVAVTMPPVGQMIQVTGHFDPPQMVGLKINLKDPFSFGFIMDQGQSTMSDSVKKEEFNKIIKYFLVSLAMPNKDMWVNLSPFESKRIIPEIFGQTEMGRDLLAQDYVLKQFTASLMYPEDGLGKKFWSKVYEEGQARFGTTDINVNTFNKVWIVADHADVYQKGDTAFLVGSHLKVMLEQDFKAIEQNKEQFGDVNAQDNESTDAKTQMASQLVREIIIPAIEKEVNEGQSFAAVRQIYNAEIMATWFKKTLRESLLGQVFADKAKIAGQKVSDPQAKEKIFQQYLLAYKQGVFNFIKQEATPDGQVIPRRYLSGGYSPVSQKLLDNEVTQEQIDASDQRAQQLAAELPKAPAPEAQNLITEQLATPSFDGNLGEVARKIAGNTSISPNDRAMIIAELVKNLPQQNPTNVSTNELEGQLNSNPDNVKETLENDFPGSTGMSIKPEMVAQVITTAPLSPNDKAGLVEHLAEPPNVEAAQEFGGKALADVGKYELVDANFERAPTIAPAQQQAPANDRQQTVPLMITQALNTITANQENTLERAQAIGRTLAELLKANPAPTVTPESLTSEYNAQPNPVSWLADKLAEPNIAATAASPAAMAGALYEATKSSPQAPQIISSILAQLPNPNVTSTADLQKQAASIEARYVPVANNPQEARSMIETELSSPEISATMASAQAPQVMARALTSATASSPEMMGSVLAQLANTNQTVTPEALTAEYNAQPPAEADNWVTQQLSTQLSQSQGLVSTIQGIQDSLTPQFENLVSQLQGQSPANTAALNELSQGGGSIDDLSTKLAEMVDKNEITKEEMETTLGRMNAVYQAQKQASGQIAANLTGVPKEMAKPLSELMVKQVINEAANKSIGGINLSNEHLTLNVKVDGAGMPLPPQYQDKALMNLNGLVSIIRSITPITQQNVPALYELAK